MPRGDTTVVDAYLSPILRRYVDQVAAELAGVRLYFMQSNGGLADAPGFQGKDAILSGPAGGIVGAARTAAMAGLDHIIGFDMGGTSTDVALYAGGFERAFETAVAGVRMRAPMMAINTVAAGGGSILHFDGARFRVGPDSAGADPGAGLLPPRRPADGDRRQCLRRQDPAGAFPGDLRPERRTSRSMRRWCAAKFAALGRGDRARHRRGARHRSRWPKASCASRSPTWRTRSSRSRCRRATTPPRFALQCFGGAGGQHACLVADALGMETVFIHPYAGVLSAYGMGLADQTVMREQAVEVPLERRSRWPSWTALADRLTRRGDASAGSAGRRAQRGSTVARSLHLRYAGTEAALIVDYGAPDRIVPEFTAAHRARFGFATPERPMVVEAVAVEATLAGESGARKPGSRRARATGPKPIDRVRMLTGGAEQAAPVFDRTRSAGRRPHRRTGADPRGQRHHGRRARLERRDHATRSHDCCGARSRRPRAWRRPARSPIPVLLELFNNLFMNVAEQTGAVLQNTSMSVNIKERLDFSCAIFDRRGLAGRQRAARPGASGRHGRERAHRAAAAAKDAEARRRRRAEQPLSTAARICPTLR